MSSLPEFKDFEETFTKEKSQLVWQWVSSDLETPVSAFLKLSKDKPYSFLLESVEGGAVLGRYSAIGLDPDLIWSYENDEVYIQEENKWKDNQPALDSLRQQVSACRIDSIAEEIPPMGSSGLFGYMGYDMVRLIEDIPDDNPDELNIPGSIMVRPTVMVIFDNVKNMICIITPIRQHSGNSGADTAREAYDAAVSRLHTIIQQLDAPLPAGDPAQTQLTTPLPVESNITREQFHDVVKKAVEYIYAGDIFQVVPSQRFSVPFDLPAFELYRSLRRLNPSPFLFYINFGEFSLVGSSPEILVRVRDDTVTIRPIAGTRKRGKNEQEDKALAAELLADPKERAEHLMLLDLGRNDIGRVAETSSVNVTDQFIVERYSHVMHIVSNVEGTLKKDMDSLDALFAGFPAGTVSGAPKVRAMEIIDELETLKRSFYGGCVGYMDGNGDLDTCIALRTSLVKDGKIYVQAGGGVVADSNPEFEYQESCNKARAIIQAAELAIEKARKKPSSKVS